MKAACLVAVFCVGLVLGVVAGAVLSDLYGPIHFWELHDVRGWCPAHDTSEAVDVWRCRWCERIDLRHRPKDR